MKILITGAGGFIGSHLVEHFIHHAYDVKALVHYNAAGRWGWLEQSSVRKEIEVLLGDIRDYDFVYSATKSVGAICHLAALIGIPYSYVSPVAYIKTNVEGTYNVLESARQRGIQQVLVTSTSETYGTAQYVPIDEKHPANAQSPYAASKIAADQLALSYHRSFNVPVKLVRPFNTYGPRQSLRAVIPTIITQILSGKRGIKLGSTSPTRDFTFVKDTVAGFLAILNSERLFGEATNIGMNLEISIGDLARLIAKQIGREVEILQEDERIRPEKSEVERLRSDNSKLTATTGWSPAYKLEKGIAETVDWLGRNLDYYKSEIYGV